MYMLRKYVVLYHLSDGVYESRELMRRLRRSTYTKKFFGHVGMETIFFFFYNKKSINLFTNILV